MSYRLKWAVGAITNGEEKTHLDDLLSRGGAVQINGPKPARLLVGPAK